MSRQALPTLDRSTFAPVSRLDRGAYALADVDGQPDVILMGTGSKVSLCIQARETLEAEGIKARVVSMPSWDQFEGQDDAYRDTARWWTPPSTLPPASTACSLRLTRRSRPRRSGR